MIMLGNPDEPDAGVLRKAKDENLVSLLRNPPSEMLETGKLLSSHLNKRIPICRTISLDMTFYL